jgi:chromosome segregation ATPase
MSSEKAKKEAVVELRALCEEVEKLQCEKTMLEGNIVELRASMEDAQSQLNRVRGDRDRLEQTASSAQLSLRRAKERIRELEKSMEVLEEQIAEKEKSQRLNESNLKKYKESELSLIGEKNSLSEQLQRSQARGVDIQAELDHTRRQLSALESNKMFKESQIATLEQQLSSARGQLEDSIQQANQLKEELQAAILTQEKLATTEEHLKEQILLGESQADQAQRRYEEVKVVVEDLHLKLASVRKEKESIEHRLQLVLQSKAEDDKRANVLHRSVQDLQEQLAQRGNSLSSHKLELEQSASQFLFQKQKIELLEAEIAELKKEKGTLLIKIESLELGLSSVEEAKHVSQNLASHLENELSRTRVSYQKLKGENSELRVSMEDSRTRQQQLDTLLSSQKRQRSDLDASLSFSNQQNSDLQRRIWELEGSMDMKEREFKKKLDEFQVEHDGEVSQRLEEVQTLHQLHEREWADREDNYRKAVGQLETKVLLLHNQIRHDKKQNKHVSGFEGEGREMQSLVDPSTQHLTPKEKRMGQTAERSPQSISRSTPRDIRKKSPRTSTPAKVSLTRSFLPLSPQRYSL